MNEELPELHDARAEVNVAYCVSCGFAHENPCHWSSRSPNLRRDDQSGRTEMTSGTEMSDDEFLELVDHVTRPLRGGIYEPRLGGTRDLDRLSDELHRRIARATTGPHRPFPRKDML